MTTTTRRWRFFLGFGLLTLLVAGALPYLADSDPDGLDAVSQRGCAVVAEEQLEGDCIAKDAEDHALGGGPLADYTVGGDSALTGLAGVLGVLATAAVAGGLFWALRKRSPESPAPES